MYHLALLYLALIPTVQCKVIIDGVTPGGFIVHKPVVPGAKDFNVTIYELTPAGDVTGATPVNKKFFTVDNKYFATNLISGKRYEVRVSYRLNNAKKKEEEEIYLPLLCYTCSDETCSESETTSCDLDVGCLYQHKRNVYTRGCAPTNTKPNSCSDADNCICRCRHHLCNTNGSACSTPRGCYAFQLPEPRADDKHLRRKCDGKLVDGKWTDYTTCTYYCEDTKNEYVLNGIETTTCQEIKFGFDQDRDYIWTSVYSPKCKHKVCKAPPDPPGNGTVSCDPPPFLVDKAKCKFSCNNKYKMVGGDTTNCIVEPGKLFKFIWEKSAPTCVKLLCTKETHKRNVISNCDPTFGNSGKYDVGAKCVYTCAEGFYMEGFQPNDPNQKVITRCKMSEEWNATVPDCKPITCAKLNSPTNGNVKCTTPQDQLDKYEEFGQPGDVYIGTKCTFDCKKNYCSKGPGVIECLGDGSWSGKPSKCEKGKCKPLVVGSNVTVSCTEGQDFGSECNLKCPSTHTLIGSSKFTCEQIKPNDCSGRWNNGSSNSTETPTCEIKKCKAQVYGPHVIQHCSNKIDKDTYVVGTQCEYTCEEGYYTKGEDMGTNITTSTKCTERETWTRQPPDCLPIICPVLKNPPNGKVVCDNGNAYKSNCQYVCDDGYASSHSNVRQCTAQGTWTFTEPTCDLRMCEKPVVNHGVVKCPQGTSINSTCTLKCNHKYIEKEDTNLCFLGRGGPTWDKPETFCCAPCSGNVRLRLVFNFDMTGLVSGDQRDLYSNFVFVLLNQLLRKNYEIEFRGLFFDSKMDPSLELVPDEVDFDDTDQIENAINKVPVGVSGIVSNQAVAIREAIRQLEGLDDRDFEPYIIMVVARPSSDNVTAAVAEAAKKYINMMAIGIGSEVSESYLEKFNREKIKGKIENFDDITHFAGGVGNLAKAFGCGYTSRNNDCED